MKFNKKIVIGAVSCLVLSVSVIVLNASALGDNAPRVGTEQNYNSANEIIPKDIAYDDLSVNLQSSDIVKSRTETEIQEDSYIPEKEEVNILKEASILTRGDSKPTKFHDLKAKNYYYDLPAIKTSYSNYYFNTNSSGEIRVQINNIYSKGADFQIVCYKVNGNAVSTWEGQSTDGYNAVFYGLDTDTHYYFQFKAVGFANYLDGDGKIYH